MRNFLRDDPRFADLPPNRLNEIARLLADVYLADDDQVRGVRHFANEHVLGVILRLGEGEEL